MHMIGHHTTQHHSRLFLMFQHDAMLHRTVKELGRTVLNQEQPMLKLMRDIFIDQERQVINQLRTQSVEAGIQYVTTKDVDIDQVVLDPERWERETAKRTRTWFNHVVYTAGRNIINELAPGQTYAVGNSTVQAFIDERVNNLAFTSVNTTNKRLRALLVQATEQHASIDEMAAAIHTNFKTNRQWRARLIARTETVSNHNYGNMSGMMQSGVVNAHMWLTAGDGEVRIAHQIDGAVVELGETFPVGSGYTGYTAEFPSDYNERCTTAPYAVVQ